MKIRRRISQCQNCKSQLNIQQNFCPECGQENHYHGNTLRELWRDFTGSIVNFDGKVYTTIFNLFLHPGKVSREFVEGKKVKYVPPFRLYLFVSFFFFLVIHFSTEHVMNSETAKELMSEELDNPAFILNLDSTTYYNIKDSLNKNEAIKKLLQNGYEFIGKSQNQINVNKTTKIITHSTPDEDELTLAKFLSLQKVDGIESIKITDHDTLKTIEPTDYTEDVIKNYSAKIYLKPKYDTFNYEYNLTVKDLYKIKSDPEILDSLMGEKYQKLDWYNKMTTKNTILMEGVSVYGSYSERKNFFQQRINTGLTATSYSMFLLMPLVALSFFMFYFYKFRNYYPHFILTIHLHTHTFFVLGICLLLITFFFKINLSFASGLASMLIFLVFGYLTFYVIAACKNFYKTSWLKSILISLVTSTVYSIILLFLITFIIAGSILFFN